jgi:hypothetical protein
MTVAAVSVATLGIAACGSSKKKATTTTAAPATTAKKPAKAAAVPSRTYRVKLTGPAETPPGAPHGSGVAVITLRGKSDQVCWTFSALKGFAHPTFAHIHIGHAGTSGNIVVPLSTGTTFLTKGCVSTSAATIRAIANDPHAYYVNVHSIKYPGGAVRSQL